MTSVRRGKLSSPDFLSYPLTARAPLPSHRCPPKLIKPEKSLLGSTTQIVFASPGRALSLDVTSSVSLITISLISFLMST